MTFVFLTDINKTESNLFVYIGDKGYLREILNYRKRGIPKRRLILIKIYSNSSTLTQSFLNLNLNSNYVFNLSSRPIWITRLSRIKTNNNNYLSSSKKKV